MRIEKQMSKTKVGECLDKLIENLLWLGQISLFEIIMKPFGIQRQILTVPLNKPSTKYSSLELDKF
jgi:hypothetical protein